MNENKKIEPTDAMVEAVEHARKFLVLDVRTILRAALNHPDAAELFADEDALRAAQELPTEDGAVIAPADGREFIEAGGYGRTYLAREAVLSYGCWYAAWRTGDGKLARHYVTSGDIIPGTWKKADQ